MPFASFASRVPAPFLLAALLALTHDRCCHAGRPLTVDDAGVNEAGVGHVEFFGGRDPGGVHTWTVAPAYGVNGWLELGASAARDVSSRLSTTAVQAKWLWSAPRTAGCNAGSVLGVAHTTGGVGQAPYVNGLLSCHHEALSVHANLGATRPRGGPTLPTWGLALDRTFGAVTAHVEGFGQRHAKPAFQLGARTEIAKDLQLDGTLGRHAGRTVFSAGVKLSF